MKATPEEIQAISDHMIRMINYPKKKMRAYQKKRFRLEVDKCRIWLLNAGQHKDIADSMIETKMIQAEADSRLDNIKSFLGL